MSRQMIVPEHLKKTEELKQSERNIQSESQKCLVRAKYRTRQNVSTRSGQPLQSKKTSRITCGARFGHLTVLEQTEERKNGYVVWRCRCDCGNEYGAVSRELRSGRAVSCKDPSCEYYREALKNATAGKTSQDGGSGSCWYLAWLQKILLQHLESLSRAESSGMQTAGSSGTASVTVEIP